MGRSKAEEKWSPHPPSGPGRAFKLSESSVPRRQHKEGSPKLPRALVIAGVSGSGKTRLGALLAERLGWPFSDADEFHAPEAIEKMRSGRPLTEAERQPWLERIRRAIHHAVEHNQPRVFTCSALRAEYRRTLLCDHPDAALIFWIAVDRQTLERRLRTRVGHFFGPELLDSQLQTAEEPRDEPGVIVIDGDRSPEEIVSDIVRASLS